MGVKISVSPECCIADDEVRGTQMGDLLKINRDRVGR